MSEALAPIHGGVKCCYLKRLKVQMVELQQSWTTYSRHYRVFSSSEDLQYLSVFN